MMGFQVGKITLSTIPPRDKHNVEVEFEVTRSVFPLHLDRGSFVKVNSGGFSGERQLEVTRGTNGTRIVVTQPVTMFSSLDELTQKVAAEPRTLAAVAGCLRRKYQHYFPRL